MKRGTFGPPPLVNYTYFIFYVPLKPINAQLKLLLVLFPFGRFFELFRCLSIHHVLYHSNPSVLRIDYKIRSMLPSSFDIKYLYSVNVFWQINVNICIL